MSASASSMTGVMSGSPLTLTTRPATEGGSATLFR